MVNTRTSGNNQVTMTQAQVDALIESRIAAALDAEQFRRNGEQQQTTDEESGERSERSATPFSGRSGPPRPRVPVADPFRNFLALKPTDFRGTEGPVALIQWLEECESHFDIVHADESDWVRYATSPLRADAMSWWKSVQKDRK